MSTRQSTIDFLLDQLSQLPHVRARKMFGEWAFYCNEKVVALVCDDQLFVKITPEGLKMMGKRMVEGTAYPGAKPSMLLGAREIEDRDFLCQLMRATADSLPAPKPKAPKRQVPKANR